MAQNLYRAAVDPRPVESPAAAGGVQICLVKFLRKKEVLRRFLQAMKKTPARWSRRLPFLQEVQTFRRSRQAIAPAPSPNKASVEGSGTGTTKPRISPPPKLDE